MVFLYQNVFASERAAAMFMAGAGWRIPWPWIRSGLGRGAGPAAAAFLEEAAPGPARRRRWDGGGLGPGPDEASLPTDCSDWIELAAGENK